MPVVRNRRRAGAVAIAAAGLAAGTLAASTAFATAPSISTVALVAPAAAATKPAAPATAKNPAATKPAATKLAAPKSDAPESDAPTNPAVRSAIPGVVDPAADLGRHPAGPEPTWFDSIYFTSAVRAGNQEFGLQVHTRVLPNRPEGAYRWTLAVINKTTGWYDDYAVVVEPKDYRWSQGELDIKAPGLSWTGNATHQTVRVDTPWGSLDAQLTPTGPALNYASTGYFTLVDGVPNYEYALPQVRTTGTLTVNGRRHAIKGTSWLDRQWGEMPRTLERWTWMNLSMPGGDKIAVWDTVGARTKHTWATVLHKDGSYRVVGVEPLADGVSRTWTSPATGQKYPTRWRLRIPALHTQLDVRITGNPDQEIATPDGGGYLEAAATFTGRYEGRRVRGENYVEMTGEWKD